MGVEAREGSEEASQGRAMRSEESARPADSGSGAPPPDAQRLEARALQSFIDSAPLSIAMFDRQMRYLAASRGWREEYGLGEAPLAGRSHYEVFPEIPPRWKEAHRRALAGEVLRGEEDRFERRDGTVHALRWEIRPWYADAGQPGGIVIFSENLVPRNEAERARNALEERFRLMAASVRDYAFFMLDPAGRVTTWNEGARRLKGYEEPEILGQPFDCFFTPEDRQADRPASLLKAAAEQGRCEDEGWRVRKDGSRFLAEGIITALRDDAGTLVGFAKTTRDVTERRALEERLRQQAMVFQVAQEGIVITDREGCITDANRAFERITEYPLDEVRGRNMRFIKSGKHDRAFYEQLWGALLATGDWRGEIWNRRKSGEIFIAWISITSMREASGAVTGYVGILIDLARMQHAQSELERLAHHDALTSLPNRTLLLLRLEQAIGRANRHHGTGAVLFLDLDGFKQVNDRLGHRAGDELLMAVAARLRVRLRIIDTLARLGGDEFVVILEDITGAPAASSVAEDLIQQLAQPFPLSGGRVVRIGGSVGIALFPSAGGDALQLLEQADHALYAAKQAGRGTHRFFGTD